VAFLKMRLFFFSMRTNSFDLRRIGAHPSNEKEPSCLPIHDFSFSEPIKEIRSRSRPLASSLRRERSLQGERGKHLSYLSQGRRA
jgi:hypothetical protein